ncbi:hypothetical protein [Roseibium marinum]|uniref:Uncharacterized protein n=1 Tax=Roseibium marinum TaxID=281252 RepID=A0A2S3UPT1_9HYPH|nr:hypothetical protein [Roseibium marinum]POF29725.1 hypothetical protein CLV41_108150 [Roseibium marinum]
MQSPETDVTSPGKSGASFPPALFYMLAAGPLLLMIYALEPMLAPPLAAFLAMTALTFRMGRRLFGELARAPGRKN